MQEIVRQLTGRHCQRLEDALKARKVVLDRPINDIIDENKKALFDAEAMLKKWVKKKGYSVYEMRSKLYKSAESVIGKHWRGNVENFQLKSWGPVNGTEM